MSSGDVAVLKFDGVSRTFNKGNFVAVDSVSLSVTGGEVHSIIGPNGAGKTTLVKLAASILTPSSGKVLIDGMDTSITRNRITRNIGLVIGGELGFYPRATAKQNLHFFADLAGISGRAAKAEVQRVLEIVELCDRSEDRVNTFSRGMTQRLHIARALLGKPKLIIMDEPTSGLDPDIAATIRQTIKSLADSGHAILLTSHTMSEIEDLSTRISVMGAGRVHISGTVTDVSTYAGLTATTTTTLDADAMERLEGLFQLPDIKSLRKVARGAKWDITIFWTNSVAPEEAQRLTCETIKRAGVEVPVDLVTRQPTLEESYIALAGELQR